MNAKADHILSDIAGYYSEKLAEHGETPRGADWNGEESQRLRFRQLLKIVDDRPSFSMNDLGCGYGALYDFMKPRHTEFSYVGFDVAGNMVQAATARHAGAANARFVLASEPSAIADYGVASGIFNVRLDHSDVAWRAHLETTLDAMDRTSRHGFAFNCLTSWSDPQRMRPELYYADPSMLFDHCKRRYARNVALLHDYDLYEFTILVRKQS
jgi:SAM-dependent methyltransferase